ncbi:MAG: acetyl-CoA carboxylase, carboxyltransferase subunit beta [Elusimicrobia bacterium]|nr:acetyl-CoA carboxylase, carboxyltransferase subunit beta [Elusimicrobiota bacterium]
MAVSSTSKGKKEIPKGVWTKCTKCEQIIYQKELDENFKICPKCGAYLRLTAKERIDMLIEKNSFQEFDPDMISADPLEFPGYAKKIALSDVDSVITGEGKIGKQGVIICVMNFDFMGGSMGSVVGEKIARATEKAIEKRLPLIIVSSSGGARMQEGIISLMQMGKTSAALALLGEHKIPYISVLVDPTTGGVAASFAMLGDVIIAEPKSLIGFAGPRVIEQTIRQKLPEGFQLSEFLMQHGMVDIISERKNLKETLIKVLDFISN